MPRRFWVGRRYRNERDVDPDDRAARGDREDPIEGAVTLARSVPLLFVVKKEEREWRISSVKGRGGSRHCWGTDSLAGFSRD